MQMRETRPGWCVLCVVLAGLAASCFETRESYGGETHFMRGCEGSCEDGLECVCGVCTKACDAAAACAELADGARCASVDVEAEACGEAGDTPASACAALCGDDGACSALGDGFVCADGLCREQAMASAAPVFVAQDSGCTGAACALAEQPLVMLLVDTSGSMERKAACACVTPSCEDCLPDCANGERNRWINVVEALGGTLEDYSCERLERTEENGATFDLGYYLPHYAPRGVPGDDGVLDLYRDRVRFGLATFDGWDTYVGGLPLIPTMQFDFGKSASMEGQWSYNPGREVGSPEVDALRGRAGVLHYPGSDTDYFVDTGVRGPEAEQGALIVATDPMRVAAVNAEIQGELLRLRPYGGTPIASSLDDLYYWLAQDPRMDIERARTAPKHIVLLTDGLPDADYRDVGCNCAAEGDPMNATRCGGDPSNPRYDPAMMKCPYPTAADAARALRCGRGESCDGPVASVHVIGYAADDAVVVNELMAIGDAGGGGASFGGNASELRTRLSEILDEITQ